MYHVPIGGESCLMQHKAVLSQQYVHYPGLMPHHRSPGGLSIGLSVREMMRLPTRRNVCIYSLEYINWCESHAFCHIPALNQLPWNILASLNSFEMQTRKAHRHTDTHTKIIQENCNNLPETKMSKSPCLKDVTLILSGPARDSQK